MKNIKYIICILIGLVVGYILCSCLLQENLVGLDVLKETFIYLDEEQQVARTEEGKKLYPLRYKNNLYIPITEIGYIMNDKEVQVQESRVDFKTVNISKKIGEFETETLRGKSFSDKDIRDNKFTVIFNWSTWCPYCKEDLVELERVYKDYELEGVQIVGLLVDEDYEEAEKLIKKNGVTFEILKTNKYLNNNLQTNMQSIPEFIILNNEGEIVTDDINGEQNILLLKNRLDELIVEECSKCGD